MSMKCDQVQPELLDYSKGLLSGPEVAQIQAHLSSCKDCAAVLEQEVTFAQQLESIPAAAPANDVWALVRTRTRPRSRPVAWIRSAVTVNLRRTAAAVTAVAAGAVLMFAVDWSGDRTSEQLEAPHPPAVTVKWSDDPIGGHTDAMIDYIKDM